MPRKFTYKEYYEKFKKDQGFRQYPYSNYMDNMYTKFPLMGDALIAEGQTALGQKLKQYGDHFRKLICEMKEGEEPRIRCPENIRVHGPEKPQIP